MSTYRDADPIVQQLRHAEQSERDELVRFNLRTTADEIDAALIAFRLLPCGAHLATINGLWARGIRTLGKVGGTGHMVR